MSLTKKILTTVKNRGITSWQDAMDLDPNWIMIGSGVFGRAYIHPDYPGIVAKLFADNAYAAFIKNVVRTNYNIHFPRVLDLEEIDQHYNLKLAVMEQLEPLDHNNRAHCAMVAGIREIVRCLGGHRNAISNWSYKNLEMQHWEQCCMVLDKNPTILGALDIMGNYLQDNFHNIDIHPGNVMLRGKTPVITDPFT